MSAPEEPASNSPELSPVRAFARDLILILDIPLVLTLVVAFAWHPWRAYRLPAGIDVFSVLDADWDWETSDYFCVKNPYHVGRSADPKYLEVTYRLAWADSAGNRDSVYSYEILESSGGRVRTQLNTREESSDSAVEVTWDLVLTSHDSYYWHRKGWPKQPFPPRHYGALRSFPTRFSGSLSRSLLP